MQADVQRFATLACFVVSGLNRLDVSKEWCVRCMLKVMEKCSHIARYRLTIVCYTAYKVFVFVYK